MHVGGQRSGCATVGCGTPLRCVSSPRPPAGATFGSWRTARRACGTECGDLISPGFVCAIGLQTAPPTVGASGAPARSAAAVISINNHPDHRPGTRKEHHMSDNTTTVIGNITRDPELRYTPGGRAQATFGLAVNRRYQQNGKWTEHTNYFNIVAWGTLAENLAATCPDKDVRIVVTGRLEHRSWDSDQGEKRHTVEIIADDLGPSLRWAIANLTRTPRNNEGAEEPF